MRLAYCDIHYGSPFFHAALQSIYDQVDKILILYARNPSQGHGTALRCPDSRDTLLTIAAQFQAKIVWQDGVWGNEGDHTNAVFQYPEVDKYDWLIRFNSDEVFPPNMINAMIDQAEKTHAGLFQFPFIHFWQSFNHVCRDGQFPYRMIRMNDSQKAKILDSENGKYTVYHFGYCQPTAFLRYKKEVTGHRDEYKPHWFEETWLKKAMKDTHPVCNGMWNPEPFDKTTLPEVLKAHPYYHMDNVI